MTILVFGASITQGFWDTNGGWVERLRKHFNELQVQDLNGRNEPTVFNMGISGNNTANVLARIESETTARTWSHELPVVVIAIGVNDSCRAKDGQPAKVSMRPETYRSNLEQIIQKAKPISSGLIFVGLSACDESKTTPVCWGDFYYKNSLLKEYEEIMCQVAVKNNIPFIPVFDKFMKALTKDPTILPDGLHPNNTGHKVIFQIVKPQLLKLLKEKK